MVDTGVLLDEPVRTPKPQNAFEIRRARTGFVQADRGDVLMSRPTLEFEVRSRFGFDETVERVQAAVSENKMTVLGVHPMSKTLTEKGFPREALSVIEVCNAKQASQALEDDIRVALMMPCPIAVYERGGHVFVSSMDTRMLSQLYDGPRLPKLGEEMYETLSAVLAAVAVA
jgi:uncharacterized protein (DUF302 family)